MSLACFLNLSLACPLRSFRALSSSVSVMVVNNESCVLHMRALNQKDNEHTTLLRVLY